ncbi:MAG: endopeptidase La [Bryobacterales bacterium]
MPKKVDQAMPDPHAEGQKTEAKEVETTEVEAKKRSGSVDVEEAEISEEKPEYPEELPVLPVRDTVLFPHAVMPLNIGRESSIALINSLGENKYLGVVTQRDPRIDTPEPSELYQVGALAMIHKVVRMPNNSLLIFCEGLERIRLMDVITQTPFYRVRYEIIPDDEPEVTPQLEALRQNCLSVFQEIVQLSPALSDEMGSMVSNIKEPGRAADFIAATLPGLPSAEKQSVLETADVTKRLEDVFRYLNKEREVLRLRNKIQSQVEDQLSQSQREFYLREQLKAIQKELGDSDEQAEVEELRQKIDESGMPADVLKEAHRELKRLSRMSPAAADYTVTRTYLDWLVALPWNKSSGSGVDVVKAKQVLDEDHYDLEKIKERILDYLAVLQLKPTLKGPILCFVGPPGVGKTSLGKSIARALGREFVRLSLGGVHDEAEIRGHRRTYIGALPGQIIQGIRRAGADDPVFVLDEVDKLGRDFRGDPSSALLEVLDPAQNNTFRDHYLDVPYDLSKVLFITTANILDPIPDALRDRMEILELKGYTEHEKIHIAVNYLIPRQIEENGLAKENIRFEEAALKHLIQSYTREAGVRNLEREIGTICRKQARRMAEKRSAKATQDGQREQADASTRTAGAGDGAAEEQDELLVVTPEVVEELLRAPRYRKDAEIADRTKKPGVAVGLAWTPAGGDILFIEATKMPGGGKGMTLTGHLGKVMQESMQAALSWVRAHADKLGIDSEFFKNNDLHLHVPAGAIPKDGPSAGITVVTALASLLTGRRVRPYLSMTGEVTLSGLVLPVGGIKEKVLAARRAGVKEVILSQENKIDVDEDLLPEQIAELQLHYVKTVEDVLDVALMPPEEKPADGDGRAASGDGAGEPQQESSEVPASQHAS